MSNQHSVTTAVSLEKLEELKERFVVLYGYMIRLVAEIGVTGIWLYMAHKQAFYMAGVGRGSQDATRRITADKYIKWAVFSRATYFKALKNTLPMMAGLLERIPGEKPTEAYRRDGKTMRKQKASNSNPALDAC